MKELPKTRLNSLPTFHFINVNIKICTHIITDAYAKLNNLRRFLLTLVVTAVKLFKCVPSPNFVKIKETLYVFRSGYSIFNRENQRRAGL